MAKVMTILSSLASVSAKGMAEAVRVSIGADIEGAGGIWPFCYGGASQVDGHYKMQVKGATGGVAGSGKGDLGDLVEHDLEGSPFVLAANLPLGRGFAEVKFTGVLGNDSFRGASMGVDSTDDAGTDTGAAASLFGIGTGNITLTVPFDVIEV